MRFSCMVQDTEYGFVDVSCRAREAEMVPPSVGLRSQALKLKFASAETGGRFVRPSLPLKDMREQVENAFSQSNAVRYAHEEYIGETISLIYSPFYVSDNKLYDAVLNKVRPKPDFESGLPDIESLPWEEPHWPIQFVPALCPGCGWDLEGHKDSLTLLCRNCHSIWAAKGRGLHAMPFKVAVTREKDVYYLPFWRIKANVSGMILNSYRDLIKAANLAKVPQPGAEKQRFYFWVQAFKAPPQAFLRIAGNMTLAQPDDPLEDTMPSARFHPVNLPVSEAAESLTIILANFVKPRREFIPRLEHMILTSKRYMLVYIPFREGHHDLSHPRYQVAVNKNMLNLSKNL